MGAVFNNPGSLGTGLLPQDYEQGQIKYVDFDLPATKASSPQRHHSAEALPGHLGHGDARRYFPPLRLGVTQLGAAGPARRQSRSQRAVRRFGALRPDLEVRTLILIDAADRGAGIINRWPNCSRGNVNDCSVAS